MITTPSKNTRQQITTLRIAVPCPLPQLFNYLPSANLELSSLKPGIRIKIPFGKRELVGIFIGIEASTEIDPKKLREILVVIDMDPIFDADMLQLLQWVSEYYHYPLGEVFSIALPSLLRKGRAAELSKKKAYLLEDNLEIPATISTQTTTSLALNEEQEYCVNTILNARDHFKVFLIDGITGSGKTEVYFQCITEQIKLNKQILVLVPEIGLTPQTIQRFQQRFSVPIALMHSDLSDKERLDNWLLAKHAKVNIIIGTRSAIFTPLPNLGLIIIDEEHDGSFKQQDSLRYSARDVAIMLAKQKNIPIVLGSATPSLESYYNAQQHRYVYLKLTKRAGTAILPHINLLDIRNQQLEDGLSKIVIHKIKQHLENQGQVLLFLNRRGFAPNLICHHCGHIFKCSRCDSAYTYHQNKAKLICHHCEKQLPIPKQCTECSSSNLLPLGLGTERIELVLKKHFPAETVARIDRDSTRKKGTFHTLLEKINQGEFRILIGTQMLAKGHHFPDVTLAVIVNADGGLLSTDLRATERMGQLIMQVAGRSGRAEKPGEVLIQTRQPDNQHLHCLLTKNYQNFCDTLLEERRQSQLPPYSYLALFRADAFAEVEAFNFLQQLKNKMKQQKGILCLGPVAAPLQKKAGKFRAQLLLQSINRKRLQNLLSELMSQLFSMRSQSKVKWSLDVDPGDLF